MHYNTVNSSVYNYTMPATQSQCTNGPLLRSSVIAMGSEHQSTFKGITLKTHDLDPLGREMAKAALETHTVQQLQALKHSMIRCF